MLVASDQLDGGRLPGVALVGELGLDGSLRPVPGAMALVAAARLGGVSEVIVPIENGTEGASVSNVTVRAAGHLREVTRHLAGMEDLEVVPRPLPVAPSDLPDDAPNLRGVIGQLVARRALEIAVAGRHNLAMVGPPGVGKTLLARAAVGLLPPMDDDEAAEVSRIHSVAGVRERSAPMTLLRPFRAPHHTISTQALVGGGPRIRPGEASLAHHGALLLDEALQFRADALDARRGPLDDGAVIIARVEGVLSLPARFMLIATYNPCPCGWSGVEGRTCACEDGRRRRYQARLSGPMRDRLDLLVQLAPAVPGRASHTESTSVVAARVAAAWCRQRARQTGANADLPVALLDEAHGFDADLHTALELRGRQMGLSLRRLHRAARVARTIADLAGTEHVEREHLDEALLHRPKEAAP